MKALAEDTGAELGEVLDRLTYPADKVRIVSCADVHGFAPEVRRRLHALPARDYASPGEVLAELGDGPA
ncbi:DUF2795 domain-containing protein [Lentzea sp. CA-135723]|uniref:DUF2795 domain-containing protein n=1 Tax=Lentzea sp. CA-135723 TaxID=3239950 RepID=UPI003D8A9824